MANNEHVALLKQGVTAWNEWRDRNFQVRPDLIEAHLSGFTGVGILGAGSASLRPERTSLGPTCYNDRGERR